MQVNRVKSNDYSNQPNFRMAVTSSVGASSCEEFAVNVEDKIFKIGFFEDLFSTIYAMISTIKKGVKYAHSLADKRNALEDLKVTKYY